MSAAASGAPRRAVFVEGPLLGHVLRMTVAGAVGLMAIFLVDLLSLLYVSRLGEAKLTAAVGFATQILFVTVSVNIGLSIAVTALVSRALGAGDRARARRLAASGLTHVALASALVVVVLWFAREPLLARIGAQGEVLSVASRYLAVTLPANVMLGLGMALSGVLRAVGDARRAMYVTLSGALVTAILDPVLIFGFGLGAQGAAIATVFARLALVVVGWRGAQGLHRLIAPPSAVAAREDARAVWAIAGPAILTNLATPVAMTWTMSVFAGFGAGAVAAFAIMDRVIALAYGPVFALSGSVGAILGQNLGAARIDRVGATMSICFRLAAGHALAMWAALWLGAPWIAQAFAAPPEAAALIPPFALWSGAGWVFVSLLFVANASFNNLGFPLLSTAFNWGRALIGVVPFVTLGGQLAGPQGAIAGVAFGSALFGAGAWAATGWVLRRLAKRSDAP